LPNFSEKFFSTVLKNIQILNVMKIRPMGAELLYADGQTDVTNLIFAFRNFANAPLSVIYFSVCGRQKVDSFLLALIWS